MKILLINPTVREHIPPFNFPLGLGIIAAIMREKGHKVRVYDQNALRTSNQDMFRVLKKQKNVDVVATGGLVTTYARLKQIVPAVKDMFPTAIIILGGGVTIEPDIIFENMPVDFCVHGEGEHTFPELCSALESNAKDFSSINGISYIDNGELVITKHRAVERNLDLFPMPAYDLFPSEIYFKNNLLKNFAGIDVGTQRCATLMWSRGCPYACSFCWRMMGPGLRFRSLDLLFDEIAFLRSQYGVDSYLFVDECIDGNRNKAKSFALGLMKSGNAAPWYSHARVDTFDAELAGFFKKSGCIGLNFGIESANNKMLKVMNKKLSPAQAGIAVRTAQKVGIVPVCTFIIGMPGENKQTIKDTVYWIIKNRVKRSVFFFATPYPGCELYHTPFVQNRILETFGTKDIFFSALGDVSDLCINLTDFTDSQLLALKRNSELLVDLFSLSKWIQLLKNPRRWPKVAKNLLKQSAL